MAVGSLTAVVTVGWTSSRPVRPDEHTSRVVVAADTETDATLTAAQIVSARRGGGASGVPGCVMPTSTRIEELTL